MLKPFEDVKHPGNDHPLVISAPSLGTAPLWVVGEVISQPLQLCWINDSLGILPEKQISLDHFGSSILVTPHVSVNVVKMVKAPKKIPIQFHFFLNNQFQNWIILLA